MYYNLNYVDLVFINQKKINYEIDVGNFKFTLCENKNIVYNNDGTFNRVRINENIFVNISKKDLNKSMTHILNNKVGEYFTLFESGMKIYIGKDFPGEYVHSRSSQSLTIYRKYIKAILIHNLKELVENSYERFYTNDHNEKHKIDGKYGFYKYKINFSICVSKKEEFYKAIILIRNDANKKKYLYDILGIKKID